ncbi:MAG: helix-turn-helix domain-containing protein [Pseudonocardiaceae bacterium]
MASGAEPLCVQERETISRELDREGSARDIAKLLGRHHSSISREIERNGGVDGYRAVAAQECTARERLVLTHAAEGRSNRGIAAILGIAERTVENHITRVFQKLSLPEGNQRVLAILELQKAQRRHGHR